MKRPYQIFIILLLLSSIAFSQSGAAKSLEIGNQWVYVSLDPGGGTLWLAQEVISDTTINNKVYSKIRHDKYRYYNGLSYNTSYRFERSDSNKVYLLNINSIEDSIIIDFSQPSYQYSDPDWTHGISKDTTFFLGADRLIMKTETGTYIKGIGLFSKRSSGHGMIDEEIIELHYVKINDLEYDKFPNFEVTFPQHVYSDSMSITFEQSNSGDFANIDILKYNIDDTAWQNIDKVSPNIITIPSGTYGIHQINVYSKDATGFERNKTYSYEVVNTSTSPSGAAKSLEIGNQWVYYRSFANPITNEVIGDTIINDVKYVIVTNTDQRYQRADSTKVYYYSINYGIERVAIDFSKDEGTVCVTGDCETTTKSYQDFLGEQRAYLMIDGSIPSSFTYYHYTYIFGIGLYSWSASGHGNYTGNSFFLKYAKIGNDVYDDYPQIDVKYQQYFNTSTFVVQITTEDVIWGSAGEAYSMFNQIEYKIGHSKWQNLFEMPTIYLPVNLTLNLEVEGTNNISFHTVDIYGHERNDTYYFEFDLTPPSIKILNNVYSNIIFSEEIKEISIEYSVNDLNFDKIGYSMNNVDWIWSEEQQSTLNITVDNVKDYIQLKAVDLAGNESDIIEINVEKIADFKLSQNYPNPFNPTTQISYELPQESDVELVIYNTLGQEINKLVDENQAIGRYNIQWNGTNTLGEQVPGGVYFYALRTKDFTKTRKMLLLR